MSQRCASPALVRIENIKKNQKVSSDSSPYYENPWIMLKSHMNMVPVTMPGNEYNAPNCSNEL